LTPGEVPVRRYQDIEADGTSGFSAIITNRRLILTRPGMFHDLELSAVGAVSYGGFRLSMWVLILGLGVLAGGVAGFAAAPFTPMKNAVMILSLVCLVAAFGVIIFWAVWQQEKVRIYSSGRPALELVAGEEVLQQLVVDLRKASAGSVASEVNDTE
jgi:hypothetical protein